MMSDPFNFDPSYIAWADQFGALVRDKARQLCGVVKYTEWNNVSHLFVYDDDMWRLSYEAGGEYHLTNLNDDAGTIIVLNLDALGVTNDPA